MASMLLSELNGVYYTHSFKDMSDEEEPKPGPSKPPDAEPSGSKRVLWGSDVKDPEEKEDKPDQRVRRQSLAGTSGYVSQLLSEHLQSGPQPEERVEKPLREQTIRERRASIKAVDADVEHYMQEASYPKPKKSSSGVKLLKAPSLVALESAPNGEKLALPLPDDVRPSSKWKPSDILEKEKLGVQVERSWVGSYIVGKDYWTEEEKVCNELTNEVRFTVDTDKVAWYDLTLTKEQLDSKLGKLKSRSRVKMDALKDEMDEEFKERRKLRLISARSARQAPTSATEDFSDEFKDCFKEVARTNNFSRTGTHISMQDADKWLEQAGILDHSRVTLVNTGMCFLASGGARHRGLAFDEFIYYLEMIAHTWGKPKRDVMRRLTACKRDPDYLPT